MLECLKGEENKNETQHPRLRGEINSIHHKTKHLSNTMEEKKDTRRAFLQDIYLLIKGLIE